MVYLMRMFWILLVSVNLSNTVYSSERDQGLRLYNRLSGIPPSQTKLEEITKMIKSGKVREAAFMAINDESGSFFNLVLKQFFLPWTNRDQNVRFKLTDFSATLIGMVRDDIDFSKILSEDIVYVSDAREIKAKYSLKNNDHYDQIDNLDLPLSSTLVAAKQSELNNWPNDVPAGVLTTRGFGEAYYNMGTNRRAVRFSLVIFLCKDIDQFHDNTRSDYHVRRDVSRSPGGDSQVYKSSCLGCHAGMDGFAGAFAYINFNAESGLIYDATKVMDKMNQNSFEYADGYITQDNSWENMWAEGNNKDIGWPAKTEGFGVRSFGQTITNSNAFSYCMATRVYRAVCLNDTKQDEKVGLVINQLASAFKANGYKMKHLFAHAATSCRGD